jgi:hypothetical protein
LFLLKEFMANSDAQLPFGSISEFGQASKELLHLPADTEIWSHLKQAIAASSGFQRWQLENSVDQRFGGLSLDSLVRRYLRDTLETLAY